ncbi:YihY/virulence factor BrkB family protein [Herbiconiux ginsengi]|uniref:Membrane protein n=1 Tax=Herbiconiux ginsengi TaxID=381665 RepID=A0A1H3SSB4_9MICO|nr:YihY/virulence factor BrkB family protein [Herbiconiux ginsengi]SDZ40435.1 membrane protein [Herbiconiux ginsengi]
MSERGAAQRGSGNTAVVDDKATTASSAAGTPSIAVDEKNAPEKPKAGIQALIARVMKLRPVRVFQHFSASGGELLASGMSFQAVFAVFAAIWVGFSIFGIVLDSNQELQDAVLAQLSTSIPGLIGDGGAIDVEALQQARIFGWTGAIALVGLVLTAVGWLASSRDAIRRIFAVPPPTTNFALLKLKDFGLAFGFGVAIILSAGVSLASTAALGFVLDLLGVEDESPVATTTGWIISVLVVFVFDTFVLCIAYRVLSGVKVPLRRLLAGAALAAGVMGVLKVLGSALLGGATSNPLLASFAAIIGIMIWLNLICRVLLIGSAWIAVGMNDAGIDARSLSPQEQEAERQRRVAEARDTLVSAERERLQSELATTHGLARRRVRKKLERLDELDHADTVKLSKKL